MYKGEIAGFPREIVERMLDMQVEQGNQRDVKRFELSNSVGAHGGGFNWLDSPDGREFWQDVILRKDFDVFFMRYPLSNLTAKQAKSLIMTGEYKKYSKIIIQ